MNGAPYAAMPDLFRAALSNIQGGRVLDIATAEGGFVEILQEHLAQYTEIVGVDVSEEALATAQARYGQQNVRFARMDAERLGLRRESFDTVSASATLHHLANVPKVLDEMVRVLRPGGRMLLTEMHSDGRTAGQTVTIGMHQWIAAVDAAKGVHHYSTLGRQVILDHVESLGLRDMACYDFSDTHSDPLDQGAVERMQALIDATLERARTTVHAGAFELRGEHLRQRLEQFGTQREPVLVVVALK